MGLKGEWTETIGIYYSNKNGQWFNKNLIVILGAISTQLLKKVVGVINSIKMKLISSWKMGREHVNALKGLWAIQRVQTQGSPKNLHEGWIGKGELMSKH